MGVFVERVFNVAPDRELLHGSGHGSGEVRIIFHRPVLCKEGDDWWHECTYQIERDGTTVRESTVIGIDEVSALLHAMSYAVSDIENRYAHEWGVTVPYAYLDDMRRKE